MTNKLLAAGSVALVGASSLLGATAADETAPLWWQHIVTPGRWTTASRFVDSSTGAITVSDEVTERIARSGDAS